MSDSFGINKKRRYPLTPCRVYFSLSIVLLLSAPISISVAENLGVRGTVYPIAEPDLLTGIYHTLQAMQDSGELAQQQQAMVRRTLAHILRPPPVVGVSDLATGQPPTRRYVDPSLVLTHDIRNTNGALVARAGTRVNPLDTMHFQERLIFINGDNQRQLHWAHQLLVRTRYQKTHPRSKVILVNGNINTSASALHQRVYFDQRGVLCHQFKITHTPTLVYQAGTHAHPIKKLVVQEVQID